jgi:hypothetical protein
MRDSNETITSRIRREDLVGLLDTMSERQRVTAQMQAVEVPPEAVGSSEPTPPASFVRTVRRDSLTPYPAQVDAAIDAIIDREAIAMIADADDDRTTQPVTYSMSETALDDFVVRFATGTGKTVRFDRVDVTGPIISTQLSSAELRRPLPRWAIVAASCFVTLVLAALLLAAA